MDKLKVVSIGGFGHSNFVFDEMFGMRNIELVGLAKAYSGEDISALRSHKFCADIPVFENYREMISTHQPDVAVISTILDLVPQLAIYAANAGCNLICEKPLAFDKATLLDVYDAVNRNNVKLTAMLTMRNEAVFRTARQIYRSGIIGEAVIVNGRKSYKYGTRPEWFGERCKYGGTIGWVGIHALDFINYITDLEYTTVAAMTGNFAHYKLADCEDNCVIILGMSNGGHATVSIDYFRPEFADSHGDDWVRIVGTNGTIEASCSQKYCRVLAGGRCYDAILEEPGCIFRDFLQSLVGKSDYDMQNISFMLNNVCINAQQSADDNSIVKIDNFFIS